MKNLSPRLLMCAGLVSEGNYVTDVGCDHAGLSISLVSGGKCPGACASEVAKGPLENARKEIRAAGLSDKITTVMSDGLKSVEPEKYGTLVLAGMGARLMIRILTDSREKLALFSEFVLQPQSEDEFMRSSLRELGLIIRDEEDLFEGRKYYHAMRCTGEAGSMTDPVAIAATGASGAGLSGLPARVIDRYGPILLQKGSDATKKHISSELLRYRKALKENSRSQKPDREIRSRELSEYAADCERALGYLEAEEV